MNPTANRPGPGIALIVTAFFCVAVMSAFGKSAAAVPTAMVVFFQSLISLLLLLPWVLRRGLSDLRTTRLRLHVVRALAGLLSQALYFQAVKEMNLVDAVLLVNAAPLFIPLVALVWLGTPVTRTVIASLGVGFVGVVLIIKPGPELLSNPSDLIALSAALFSAMALVSVNRLSNTDAPDTILFYYFFISALVAAPFAAFYWKMPTAMEWGWLGGIGVFMALAQLFIILAYRCASASQIAPFNYSVVVFSGVMGWLFWHDTIGWIGLAGMVLVCIGGILSIVLAHPTHGGHAFWLSHGHGRQRMPSGPPPGAKP